MRIVIKAFLQILLVAFCLPFSISSGGERPTQPGPNVEAIGVVKYCAIVGGTREVRNHSGFFLSRPEWFVAPSDFRGIVFLRIDRDWNHYLDKRVRIKGALFTVPGRKLSSILYENSYRCIAVDSVTIID